MNIFELKIWDNESKLCTFYTVQDEDATESETDHFFSKYENEPGFETAVQVLLYFVLNSIGNEFGAIDELFNRYENEVTGLPVQGNVTLGTITFHYPDFPLRLYALKINEEIDLRLEDNLVNPIFDNKKSFREIFNEVSQISRKDFDRMNCELRERIIQKINEKEVIINNLN